MTDIDDRQDLAGAESQAAPEPTAEAGREAAGPAEAQPDLEREGDYGPVAGAAEGGEPEADYDPEADLYNQIELPEAEQYEAPFMQAGPDFSAGHGGAGYEPGPAYAGAAAQGDNRRGPLDEYLDMHFPVEGYRGAERAAAMQQREQAAAALKGGVRSLFQQMAGEARAALGARAQAMQQQQQWQAAVAGRAYSVGAKLRENVFRLVPELEVYQDTQEEVELLMPLARSVMFEHGIAHDGMLGELARHPDAFRTLTVTIADRLRRHLGEAAKAMTAEGKRGTPLGAPLGAPPGAEPGRVERRPAGRPAPAGVGFKEAPTQIASPTWTPRRRRDPALAEYDQAAAIHRERWGG